MPPSLALDRHAISPFDAALSVPTYSIPAACPKIPPDSMLTELEPRPTTHIVTNKSLPPAVAAHIPARTALSVHSCMVEFQGAGGSASTGAGAPRSSQKRNHLQQHRASNSEPAVPENRFGGAFYCFKACQIYWKYGGHKKKCVNPLPVWQETVGMVDAARGRGPRQGIIVWGQHPGQLDTVLEVRHGHARRGGGVGHVQRVIIRAFVAIDTLRWITRENGSLSVRLRIRPENENTTYFISIIPLSAIKIQRAAGRCRNAQTHYQPEYEP
ncbi:hypothetical protein DFH09DRAFT_1077782 [Mycena vulgaris]|nr:hypothetical protein DFH09DRAFT_1077782 [Mycena vulgaris]